MRMPPFMRQSNASPLTLAGWQYALLMRWANGLQAPPPAMEAVHAVRPLSARAEQRRAQVLALLDRNSAG
jgi:hypothetical protein